MNGWNEALEGSLDGFGHGICAETEVARVWHVHWDGGMGSPNGHALGRYNGGIGMGGRMRERDRQAFSGDLDELPGALHSM